MRTLLLAGLVGLTTLAVACSPSPREDRVDTGPQHTARPAADTAPAMPAMTWWIDTDTSQLTFITVKNGDFDEEHELTGVSGSLTEDGELRMELDMATVETFIPIRNERMAEHLFQTADHPFARIEAKLDYGVLWVEVGETQTTPVDFTLMLRDIPLDLTASVRIEHVADGHVRVTTAAPISVAAAPLQLMDGIDTLQELAGLESIDRDIAVNFTLELRR